MQSSNLYRPDADADRQQRYIPIHHNHASNSGGRWNSSHRYNVTTHHRESDRVANARFHGERLFPEKLPILAQLSAGSSQQDQSTDAQ